ncbi:MAG: NAD(+)/NADH kinase [Thermoproteus sp.]|nr:NAD(+)/NADH kinase [Thermoproteus sp.]
MIALLYREDLKDVGIRLMRMLNAEELSCSRQPDITVIVGGDGTLLNALHRYPCVVDSLVVHVGSGNVNFYRSVRIGEMPLEEIAERISAEDFNVVEFSTIDAGHCLAVNEVVARSIDRRLLAFKISSGSLSLSGRADGVIISTPQGSTGYILSTFGPVVDYRIPAFVISFIAPYTLYLRPLVVPQEPVLVETLQDAEISCDGYDERRSRRFVVKLGKRKLRLAVFGEYDYHKRVLNRLLAQ